MKKPLIVLLLYIAWNVLILLGVMYAARLSNGVFEIVHSRDTARWTMAIGPIGGLCSFLIYFE